MLDLRQIREAPEEVVRRLDRREAGYGPAVEEILSLDARRREALTEVNGLKAERNTASKEIGARKRAGEDAAELIDRMKAVGEEIAALDRTVADAEARMNEILLGLPNLPLDEVPAGC